MSNEKQKNKENGSGKDSLSSEKKESGNKPRNVQKNGPGRVSNSPRSLLKRFTSLFRSSHQKSESDSAKHSGSELSPDSKAMKFELTDTTDAKKGSPPIAPFKKSFPLASEQLRDDNYSFEENDAASKDDKKSSEQANKKKASESQPGKETEEKIKTPSEGKDEDNDEEKKKLRGFIDFVSGKEQDAGREGEEKRGKKEDIVGLFSFFRKNWNKEYEDVNRLNVWGRITSIYGDFQSVREGEMEKLNIYDSISLAARLNTEFLVLLFGSCLIATFGLFQDSSAVIIGAMLIAPLMMPILGFSLGTVWGDRALLLRSVSTLFIGSLMVLFISTTLSYVIPGVEFNEQISARINPNLYDILIALASGFVGAYAYVNPRISSSISGVAIAVALMPPLCTVGISLGQGNGRAALGAFLLYITNLVGISLAASLIFWRMRVHPVSEQREEVTERTARNIYLSAFLLILISIPLAYFMVETFKVKQVREKLQSLVQEELPNADILSLESSRFGSLTQYRLVLIIPESLQKQKITAVKNNLKRIMPAESTLKLSLVAGALIEKEKGKENRHDDSKRVSPEQGKDIDTKKKKRRQGEN